MMPMLILAVLLQCFDQYSTLLILQGGGWEWMPVPAMFIDILGYAGLIVVKTYAVGGLCFIAWIMRPVDAVRVLGVLNGFYLVLLGSANARFVWRLLWH